MEVPRLKKIDILMHTPAQQHKKDVVVEKCFDLGTQPPGGGVRWGGEGGKVSELTRKRDI